MYNKLTPIAKNIDHGINNFNAVYKKIINPIINEYQGEHEDRIKHANKHYMKAINEYDNLRSKALAMRSQEIQCIKIYYRIYICISRWLRQWLIVLKIILSMA